MNEAVNPASQEDSTADAGEPGANRSALLIIFLVVFIDLFGFGIVLPLLPRYGKEFLTLEPGATATALERSLATHKDVVLGLLLSSFSLMQFFFAPIWGRISDTFGRRPILLIGLASSVVFYALFGIASIQGAEGKHVQAIVLLFVARIGAGIAGATLGTAQAAIADSTSAKGRSRGMAIIGAAFGIGFLFGPLLAYAALRFFPGHPGAAGFLAAGLSSIAFFLGLALLPETRRAGTAFRHRRWIDLQGWRLARQSGVARWIGIAFLATLAFANFEPTLALLTTTRGLGLSDSDNFLLFAYVGLVLGLAQGALYRPLARRVSEYTFLWVGSLLMIVGLAGLGVVASWAEQSLSSAEWRTTMAALLAMLAVAVTGFAFLNPSTAALVSRGTDPGRQGEILGVSQSASAVARILGPALGVWLYFRSTSHVAPYVFGAILLAIVLVICSRTRPLPDARHPGGLRQ
jgi:MFS family permease